MSRFKVSSSPAYRWGGTALFLATIVILTALVFEHVGGMRPCPLCLQQRWAYYFGIPLTFLALVVLSAGRPGLASMLFAIVGLAFLANAGLAGYHAGVEWEFWPGPETCSGALQPLPKAGNMLEALQKERVVRCDAAAWRFGGLSFAGWNVVASLMLLIASLKAAFAAREHEQYL